MKKHEHNIDLYKQLRNEGMSWAEIAAHLQIPQTSIITWIKTNFDEIVIYDYVKK
jgi:transposase